MNTNPVNDLDFLAIGFSLSHPSERPFSALLDQVPYTVFQQIGDCEMAILSTNFDSILFGNWLKCSAADFEIVNNFTCYLLPVQEQ